MAEEEEADSITPGLLSDRCDTDFSGKSSMEQHIVSVHVSTKHNEKPIKNEAMDKDVSSSNINDSISTRHNENLIKNEFIERDVSSSNSNDCIALHTEMDIKFEPASFSDTECETEQVCDETDIKTKNLLAGQIPSCDTEIKVELYVGTDSKTENPFLDKMLSNDTERKEKVNDRTDTKTENILLDGMRLIDTESKMTHARSIPYNVDECFLCKQCDAKFHVKSALAQHMLVHDSTTGPERSTTTTGQRISDELHQASRSAVNTLQLPAACSNSRVQTNPTPAKTDYPESEPDTSFNTHLRTDTGGTIIGTPRNKGPKPYKCNLCDFKCAKRYYLKSHLRTHSGDRPYKCKLCDYRATQKSYLKSHFTTHTKEKPYKCKLCDYRAAQKCNLKSHFTTHTQEKPYKCKLCDYRGARKRYLEVHFRTHAQEKPYQCDLCDYKTVQKYRLKLHVIRTHTREKPYKCNLCKFKSASSTGSTVHLIKHTGDKPYKCSLCNYKTAEIQKYRCSLCKFRSDDHSTVEEHMKTHYTSYKTLQMF